jgi:hypothetical protein
MTTATTMKMTTMVAAAMAQAPNNGHRPMAETWAIGGWSGGSSSNREQQGQGGSIRAARGAELLGVPYRAMMLFIAVIFFLLRGTESRVGF